LDAIVNYIAQDNADAAHRVFRAIVQTAQNLPQFPALGRPGRHPNTREITVAGQLTDLWLRMVPGSDLEFRGGANSPSLLIDGVAIAGK
jgi:plasmid stabilization system protein ParE